MEHAAAEEALGGSLAADELKGDLAAAAALDAPPAWAAVVAALRGELVAARALAAQAPESPAARAAVALAAAGATELPTGEAAVALELGAPVPPPASGDARADLLAALPALRTAIAAERGADADAAAALADGLARIDAVAGDWPFAQLVAADLCHRAGAAQQADARLEAAERAYEAADDVAGTAATALARGDWLATPEGHPLALGLDLIEPAATDTSELLAPPGRYLAASSPREEALAAYERARAGFAAAGAPRGVAAVDLRRAAVCALSRDAATARRAAEAAHEACTRAGDDRLAQVASAHAALARIADGELPEDRAAAAAIGRWGRESGARGWALGLGMLFGQAGWRRLRGDGDADGALACHRLAEAAFAALGAGANLQQAIVDQSICRAALGDWDAASVDLDRAADEIAQVAAAHPEAIGVLDARDKSLASRRHTIATARLDASRIEALRPATEALLAFVESFPPSPEQTAVVAGLRAQLEADTVAAPLYRAMTWRRRWPKECTRQRGRALDAAQSAVVLRGRLEALVHLERRDLGAARAAHAAHPPDPSVPRGADFLEEEATLLVKMQAWPEARAAYTELDAQASPESLPWPALADRARVAEGLGESGALDLYERAVAALEASVATVERAGDRAGLQAQRGPGGLYGDAARATLAAAGEHPQLAARAFVHAERGTARGLLERMAAGAARRRVAPGVAGPLAEWRRVSARLSLLRTFAAAAPDEQRKSEIDRLAAELADAEAALAGVDPRWLQSVNPPGAILTPDEVATRLAPGTALIAHHLAPGAVLGWAITADGLVAHALTEGDTQATADLIDDLAVTCKSPSVAFDQVAAAAAKLLLAPFDAVIAAHEHLVLAPHGGAHGVPLQALPWRCDPLIATHTVTMLPSASALALLPPPKPPATDARLLAVGDPDHMSHRGPGAEEPEGYDPLRWVGAQAAELASRFEGDALLGPDAREEAVRAAVAGHRLLHLGTHGVLGDAPLLSCVLLAEGDTLDVWELLSLDLDLDLVALDACNTAGAPVTPGDELVGMAWLTLAAGARAVVGSLWRVHEVATALLMRAFYASLAEGHAPRAAHALAQRRVRGLTAADAAPELAALRDAARSRDRPDPGEPSGMPADFSHPHYWAGFVLLGA